MSANADMLQASGLIGAVVQEQRPLPIRILAEPSIWNPEDFAREQIRGLVRRVFFANEGSPVKQVVFSAAEPNTDVMNLCERVGQALALETRSHVAVVGRERRPKEAELAHSHYVSSGTIKSWATQTAVNLWNVPELPAREGVGESGTGMCLIAGLADLRSEFEYSVIHGPTAGTSSEAALLGQLADGIILVLGVHTRRATACKIKETLAAGRSRILGTVLSERKFPVPERIYRRL